MILTSEQARRFDRRAFELGVPGLVLMENACRGVAAWLAEVAPDGPVIVLCGPGNNGGDGMGIARYLAAGGRDVRVLLGSEDLSDDAAVQRRWCDDLGLPVRPLGRDASDLAACFEGIERPWVVDSLFGTGLSRPLESPWADWVHEVARWRSEGRLRGVLAVDVPSGLDADLATPIGPHVSADVTLTFVAEKPACVLSPNAEACGRVQVLDLGFPAPALLGPPTIERVRGAEVARLLPGRPAAGHKGTFGHLLVVGGSRGMDGAPALTAEAALRSGLGLVTVAAPSPTAERVGAHLREALTMHLEADVGGGLTIDAVESLSERMQAFDAVALGPGLGQGSMAREVARRLALSIEAPLVLDADGLNAFAGRLDDLQERPGPTILTPHPGEMGRLLECDVEKIVRDPVAVAAQAAERCGQVVVLKSAATVIAEAGKPIAVVREGSSGMATAGSGDVLTGVLGALLARGLPLGAAARIGVWAHATAGSAAADERSAAGMIAGDILPALSRVWAGFEG